MTSTEDLAEFFRHQTNLHLARILFSKTSPVSFGKIAVEYGAEPPLASIAISLAEAQRLGIVRIVDSKGLNGKTSKLYHLTGVGKKILSELH